MKFKVFLPQAPLSLKTKLDRLIGSKITAEEMPIWTPEFFHVHESPYFNELSKIKQKALINQCSEQILRESIAIENAGIAYANKMALLSKSQEERSYYTSVAREELNHLLWLKPYFDFDVVNDTPEFAKIIEQIILSEGRRESIVMIQVLLEGWGLSHYQDLLEGCETSSMKNVIKNILKDETRHHGGGVIIYSHDKIKNPKAMIKKIQNLINDVRIGPVPVAQALCTLNDISSIKDKIKVLESIDAIKTTNRKLKIIKQNLAKVLSVKELNKIDFNCYSIEEMAESLS